MTMLSLRALDSAQYEDTSSRSKHSSYRGLFGGEDRFLCEHYCRLNVMHESEIIDLHDSTNSLHVVQHQKAGKTIIEINNLSKHHQWSLHAGQLHDEHSGDCLAMMAEVGSHLRSLLANIADLEPYPHVITDAHKRRVLCAMFHAPKQEYYGFNKVVQLLRVQNQRDNEILRMKIVSWPASLSLALALALIELHPL